MAAEQRRAKEVYDFFVGGKGQKRESARQHWIWIWNFVVSGAINRRADNKTMDNLGYREGSTKPKHRRTSRAASVAIETEGLPLSTRLVLSMCCAVGEAS